MVKGINATDTKLSSSLCNTIALEMGKVDRFSSGEKFASYVGKVPRVSSSGVRPTMARYARM
jgi:transposase